MFEFKKDDLAICVRLFNRGSVTVLSLQHEAGDTEIRIDWHREDRVSFFVEADFVHNPYEPYLDEGMFKSLLDVFNYVLEQLRLLKRPGDSLLVFRHMHVFGRSAQPDQHFDESTVTFDENGKAVLFQIYQGYDREEIIAAAREGRIYLK